jgi:hypothetical protein
MERPRPKLTHRGELTPKGQQAHELVRLDHTLRANADPQANLAISEKLQTIYSDRREELIVNLGLPKRPGNQRRRIDQLKDRLEAGGFPFWRIHGRVS